MGFRYENYLISLFNQSSGSKYNCLSFKKPEAVMYVISKIKKKLLNLKCFLDIHP